MFIIVLGAFDQTSILHYHRHGAEEVEPGASGGTASRSQAFQGRAYRLGDSEDTSEVIHSRSSLPHHQQQVVMVMLLLYFSG